VTKREGIKLVGKLPKRVLKSMTMDSSLEFAKQTVRRKTFGVQTYFCNPSASWQKEGVENSNSWIRGDLTRKTDLHEGLRKSSMRSSSITI
jgi:IS30 family transposase